MHRAFMLILLLSIASCRSKDGDFNVFSTEDDVNMGRQFTNALAGEREEFPLLDSTSYPKAYGYLRQMITSILSSDEILHRDEFAWELFIIENDTMLNAFCTPGGYIYVYSGLIKFLDSEDQLAGVLGHEIAHADLRHSTEQLTKNYGISIIIKAVLGDAGFLGEAAGSLLSLNFSRSDENEADMQSVAYLMDTEYDPRGVARFFEKMQAKGETMGHLEFLSTHPNPENRVENIYSRWQELGRQEGKEFKDRYKDLKASLP